MTARILRLDGVARAALALRRSPAAGRFPAAVIDAGGRVRRLTPGFLAGWSALRRGPPPPGGAAAELACGSVAADLPSLRRSADGRATGWRLRPEPGVEICVTVFAPDAGTWETAAAQTVGAVIAARSSTALGEAAAAVCRGVVVALAEDARAMAEELLRRTPAPLAPAAAALRDALAAPPARPTQGVEAVAYPLAFALSLADAARALDAAAAARAFAAALADPQAEIAPPPQAAPAIGRMILEAAGSATRILDCAASSDRSLEALARSADRLGRLLADLRA